MSECVTGCKPYDGGERRHHKDCPHYPESFTKMYDDLNAENKRLREALAEYGLYNDDVLAIGKGWMKVTRISPTDMYGKNRGDK